MGVSQVAHTNMHIHVHGSAPPPRIHNTTWVDLKENDLTWLVWLDLTWLERIAMTWLDLRLEYFWLDLTCDSIFKTSLTVFTPFIHAIPFCFSRVSTGIPFCFSVDSSGIPFCFSVASAGIPFCFSIVSTGFVMPESLVNFSSFKSLRSCEIERKQRGFSLLNVIRLALDKIINEWN